MTSAALAQSFPILDFDSYLEIESNAANKHEFYHGIVLVKADDELNHDTIKMTATLILGGKLSASTCFMTSSDFKVSSPKRNAAFYPDLAIHCHPRSKAETTILQSPSFILEVLSPSTDRYDLTTKRKEYFRIPSLRHYLLIDSATPKPPFPSPPSKSASS